MATILNETRSTSGSPYVYYTVAATTSNRTTNSIDVKVTVTSRLANSGSTLGSGDNYGIRGFIEIEDVEYELVLKKKADSWSGTTKHSVSKTITIDNLKASQTLLDNIKFRAIRTSGNTSNAGYLKATSCKDIEIPIGHTPPSDVTYTITELNQKLIDAGITNDLFVENLSKKQFDISAVLYDDASISKYSIYNYFQVYSSQTTPITIDFSVDDMFASNSERDMVYIRARVDDSLGGSTWSENPSNTFDTYNYIPYSKVNLVETSTSVKRNGQTSGKVKLNVSGNYYNSDVGTIDQTNYKPIIKYKFWKNGSEEPSTYGYTIPSENIVIENGKFSVTDYEIGSSVETAANWFNPELAYKVKVYVKDNFTEYASQEKPIAVGEATWTEYKDRVDFKRITIKGVDVVAGSGGSSEGGVKTYGELPDKPSIGGVTLVGNKTLDDLNIQPKGNYLTSIPSQYVTETELSNKGYITGYTESDPIFSASPSASITNEDITNWNAKSEFSGSYDDLTNKPTIPSNYVTTDTTQDVTGAKNFKNVMKIQNGQGTGSLWIGGDVNANTLTNNKRRLARVVVPTFSDITKGATLLGFDSSGDSDLHVANKGADVVSFGGMKKITNATSPMGIAFCVANTRDGMSATNKIYPLEMDANEARFNVQPNYNGVDLATIDDIPTKTSDLTNDSGYLTEHQDISGKQDVLVSGTNIKTINNQSLLGSGNITISSGSGGTSDYNSLENIPQINSVSLVGNKTLDDLGIQAKGNYLTSIPSEYITESELNAKGYLTEHQDISEKQDKLNIITATLTSDKSITGTATTNDIALTQYSKLGDKLSVSSGSIVIGSGVTNVLVSGSVRITNDATSGNTAYNCYIYKNDEVVASSRMYGIGNGGTGACSTPSVLVSVSEGDVIKLAIWKASSNKCTIGSTGNATLLTVQAI